MVSSDRAIFESLHPAVQRAIEKRWKGIHGFRPVQRAAIPPILQGNNCLVVSPTAGGKTEAAFLPVLSCIYESASKADGVHAIYIAPLKALLNDLEDRLQEWLKYVDDITLFKWHGDVGASQKQKQRQTPASFLLTTPESLDVILASGRINRFEFLKAVRVVVVDEAHYFAADSRGSQLAASLERIQFYAERPIQRVGLSATVGDPEAVGQWLAGSADECRLIKAEGAPRSVSIQHILINEEEPDYQTQLQAKLRSLVRTGKTIIFGNSKRDVEMTARLLDGQGLCVTVHHGCISKLLREEAEELMRSKGLNAVISATSTLELGIDIGDLNRVIQKDTLPSVNSYLQRIGRAGRKDGNAEIILLSASFEDFVLNMAMATLGAEHYFEPLRPSRRRYDILFQQLLLAILENHGMSGSAFFDRVSGAHPFSGIARSEFEVLVGTWLQGGFLLRDGDLLILGPAAEKAFGARNYMELYAVFEASDHFSVLLRDEEIGSLESWFANSLHPQESVFQLGGRKWIVEEVTRDLKRVYVRRTKDALPPNWHGGSGLSIEYVVARRYHDILDGAYDVSQHVSPAAVETIQSHIRGHGHNRVPEGKIGLTKAGRELWIETYAGTMVNLVLTFLLEERLPGLKVTNNFYRIEVQIGKRSAAEIISALRTIVDDAMNLDYVSWVSLLTGHVGENQYSRFSEFVPASYSIHHAAEVAFPLVDFLRYVQQIQPGFVFARDSEDFLELGDG